MFKILLPLLAAALPSLAFAQAIQNPPTGITTQVASTGITYDPPRTYNCSDTLISCIGFASVLKTVAEGVSSITFSVVADHDMTGNLLKIDWGFWSTFPTASAVHLSNSSFSTSLSVLDGLGQSVAYVLGPSRNIAFADISNSASRRYDVTLTVAHTPGAYLGVSDDPGCTSLDCLPSLPLGAAGGFSVHVTSVDEPAALAAVLPAIALAAFLTQRRQMAINITSST